MRGYEKVLLVSTEDWAELRIPMRGYEWSFNAQRDEMGGYASPWGVMSYGFSLKLVCFICYASPWGVMSDDSLNKRVGNSWVTHPHEGLWEGVNNTASASAERLRIPMRGYETRNNLCLSLRRFVTHPHEGLWAA